MPSQGSLCTHGCCFQRGAIFPLQRRSKAMLAPSKQPAILAKKIHASPSVDGSGKVSPAMRRSVGCR